MKMHLIGMSPTTHSHSPNMVQTLLSIESMHTALSNDGSYSRIGTVHPTQDSQERKPEEPQPDP
jgi:hypothetical protein